MLPSLGAACLRNTSTPPPPPPTVIGVTNNNDVSPSCGVAWSRNVGWTLSAIDDVNYTISIVDYYTLTVMASGLLPSSSPEIINTGVVADGGGTGFFHNARYTVQLVRNSDSSVVSSMLTSDASIETGPFC